MLPIYENRMHSKITKNNSQIKALVFGMHPILPKTNTLYVRFLTFKGMKLLFKIRKGLKWISKTKRLF